MIGNLIQAIKYEMKNNIPIITIWIMAMLSSLACRKNSVGSAGVIRSVSPDGGHFSSVVTIRGEGFDSINGYVTVDGVMAPITQISSTSITLTVPTTHTGPVVVKRTTGGSTTGPTFTYVDDVLVAGSLFGYSYYPVYWDNGVPFQLLTSVGGANSTATGITSSGNDIYVCGYLYYGVNPVAELWKNGTEQTLTSTTQYAEAQAIQVSGQHVFVVGYLNNGAHDIATLWVNGQATNLAADTVNSYANAITIAGNDVYIAGYENSTQSNSSNRIALYWKNGTAVTLSDGTVDALTTGIAVVGTDIYVSGNMGGGVLWKDGVANPLSYFAAGLCSYGNGLYLAGESSSYYGNSANVWGMGRRKSRL
jgi:IPT/TIG domain